MEKNKRLGEKALKGNSIRKKLAFVLSLVMVALAVTGCGSKDGGKENLKLGTGGTGGNYYSYGANLSEYMEEQTDYSVEVVSTAGSAANLRLISDGYLDMAIVQSDTLAAALNGEGAFKDAALSGFHAVTGLYTEKCQVIVAADSDIQSIGDLKGKRVSIGAKDSGVLKNAEDILACYGINEKDIQAVNLDFTASAESLKNGEIDAFFCTASTPTTAVAELSEEMDIRVLSISDAAVNRLTSSTAAYLVCEIEAETYDGQAESITVVGVSAVLIAADTVSPEAEAAVLGILNSYNDDLQDLSFGVHVEEEKKEGRMTISLDMYQTLALAVVVLFLGSMLKKKIKFLETFCIPAPVVGGLLFAVLSCVLFATGVIEFNFDETLKNVCMIMFFTSVGFQANLKVLKSGGVSLIIFLVSVVVLIILQNLAAVGLASALKLDPLIGLCTGSIPMVGGHGTAGAFGQVLEDLGLSGATTLCTASATFGLVAGSLMGGPIGRRLILKHDLLKKVQPEDDSVLVEDVKKHHRNVSKYAPAAYQIAIAMGIGTIVSMLLSKTGMTFPVYIGAMIVAAFMRNIGEFSGKFTVHMGEINDIGGICLSLFLGIAMVTLKLWQLASLALPLVILLLAQTVLMFLFAYFVVFNIMGRNYDAAVLSAGTTGFGMGATPNAMANMQALTDKFAPSVKAYILVPIVGSMFADFINSIVITFFINLV